MIIKDKSEEHAWVSLAEALIYAFTGHVTGPCIHAVSQLTLPDPQCTVVWVGALKPKNTEETEEQKKGEEEMH